MKTLKLGFGACLLVACGGAAPPPAESPAKAPETNAPVKPAPSTREASSELRRYWAFGAEPNFALYADLDSLLHSQLFEGLVPSVLTLAGDSLRGKQRNCVDALVAGTREVAVGGNQQEAIALLAFSEDGMRAVRSTCLGVLFPVDRIKVEGANEAYASGKEVVAVEPSVVLIGPKAMVEAALATQSPTWPTGLTLSADEHVAFNVALKEPHVSGHGALRLSPERFRIELRAELPSEELAKDVESQFNGLRSSIPALGPEGKTAGAPLLNALTLTRDGQRIEAAFEVRGSTADQARELGTAAALGVFGVRRYLQQAKTAEARAVLAQIAKSYVTAFAEPAAAGAPAKKKLVSLPPVPAAIPRGARYQSAASDWTTWQSIHFSLSEPQYYQYEVQAAKDGNSAELLARGDLNGDGKSSLFRLKLKLDAKTKQLVVSPELEEQDATE